MKIIEGDFIVLVSMHWQQHFSYYIYVENYCDFKFTTISEFLWSLSSFMLQFLWQTATNFPQSRHWCSKSQFCIEIPSKWGIYSPYFFLFLEETFSTRKFSSR